jgi:hypothetical protein
MGRQGIETANFGKWLTSYLSVEKGNHGLRVFYDHGDAKLESNVAVPKAFVGEKIVSLNWLADVDLAVVDSNSTVRLLIEFEERARSPKAILGNVFASLICDRFAILIDGKQTYFAVDDRTQLIVAGVMPAGDRLSRIQEIILPRLRSFSGLSGCVRPSNVQLAFAATTEFAISELKKQVVALLPASAEVKVR